jgi:hypothetical protein
MWPAPTVSSFFRGFSYTATASTILLHSFLLWRFVPSRVYLPLAYFSKPVTSTTRHFRLLQKKHGIVTGWRGLGDTSKLNYSSKTGSKASAVLANIFDLRMPGVRM